MYRQSLYIYIFPVFFHLAAGKKGKKNKGEKGEVKVCFNVDETPTDLDVSSKTAPLTTASASSAVSGTCNVHKHILTTLYDFVKWYL
jgi:hypothetical protein